LPAITSSVAAGGSAVNRFKVRMVEPFPQEIQLAQRSGMMVPVPVEIPPSPPVMVDQCTQTWQSYLQTRECSAPTALWNRIEEFRQELFEVHMLRRRERELYWFQTKYSIPRATRQAICFMLEDHLQMKLDVNV
jgi:hypothetical protein